MKLTDVLGELESCMDRELEKKYAYSSTEEPAQVVVVTTASASPPEEQPVIVEAAPA
jgi:hypothetical protein